MSLAAPLAAAAVLLCFAAIRELHANGADQSGRSARVRIGGRDRAAAAATLRLGIPARIARAGLSAQLPTPAVLGAKLICAFAGALVGLAAAPAAPGRLQLVVLAGGPAAGFLAPDAVLERAARRRRRRLLAALPDALDLLAVSASAGRSTAAGFADIASTADGPLARELAVVAAEMQCGVPQPRALAALRERLPGTEVAGLIAAIERSRRYGSPLADQLRRRSTALRRDHRRAVEERAARAAPKIQLVVALVLVPSVLLMIVAGLIANADVLLGGL